MPTELTWYGTTGDPIFEIPSDAFEAVGFMLLVVISPVKGELLVIPRFGNAWMLGLLTGAGARGLRCRRGVIVSTTALAGVNIYFTVGIGLVTGVPIPSLTLSAAPDGMPKMAITTKLLAPAAPLVAAFYIVRIFFVISISGLVFCYGVCCGPPLN